MPKTKNQIILLTLLYGLFGVSAIAFLWIATRGPVTLSLFNMTSVIEGLSLAIRLDSISTIILLMAAFLGIVIGQYSVRYLDGERHQDAFFRNLCFTVFAVALFVTASNLVVLFIAWLAMSLGLHRLLLFYPERANAVYAARKKFLVSRLGDLFLIIGIALVYKALGTFEFNEIFEAIRGPLSPGQHSLISWSGIFFACGAMTKSAQLPFHFWLPETMETPTPVSALMHAGIINAGGFLLLRLSPIFAHASYASLLLAGVGAFTGVFASLVMVTQNDIKRKLAYSTISQMGLMIFACGIGAYTFALFHIVAHSFYKAHAFLSTGDLVKESKKISLSIKPQSPLTMILFVAFGLSLILLSLNWQEGRHLPEITYLSVLILGLVQSSQSLETRSKIGIFVIFLIGLALAIGSALYAVFEGVIHLFASGDLVVSQKAIEVGSPLFVICVISYLIFAIGFFLSNGLMQPKGHFQKQLYVYLWNGGYFEAKGNRVLRAFRLL